ncbi:PREDICTED: splicing factor 3B subunit 4-like [Camelina sativa]|uniref:Splicing factor 3B subunit 4-like n=1 Tax=Camelina sativa TaxID=90675 RepID=A0ABM0XS83_CAMSA|nr:PREDICTED: splicing factor 3B subunit 4-like [Camelina sativa]
MTTRITPGVGANLLGQHAAERNQDATVYVGNLDPQRVSEELLWELFAQAGPVVNVFIPKDKVTNVQREFGFVQFRNEEDADYAIKVLNMIKLYGEHISVKKTLQDKESLDVGAHLFIGNLDPDVDEKLLYDTFSAFGLVVNSPKIMRDQDTGNSRGFGFISYNSFEASDAAIEAMNGQYLSNRQITVSYAYKKDTKGERHGTQAERLLAATNPSSQKSRPHTLFASIPPTHLNAPKVNGQPRPFANGGMQLQPVPIPARGPPPPPQAYQTQPPFWPSQQQQQHGLVVPPPMQFRPPQGIPPPSHFHHHQQGFGGTRPPPPPQVILFDTSTPITVNHYIYNQQGPNDTAQQNVIHQGKKPKPS